ncbi:hypothetical protein L6164_031692 [Bauhinia variegata]|uniref:Uncharacterized protein n=1 Tax=Bauhinia variegata TaxID=167791 RepID=A0ACB9LFR4_BAUVA|nr:hypothetical protein L6164_031692 [Bauhinia variegata]
MEMETHQPQLPSSATSNGDQLSMKEKWRKFITHADHLLTANKDEWLEDMRGNLSMVAALISTITFQAALNPPGGLVQTSTESNGTKIDCSTLITKSSKINIPANTTICTGESVFAVLYQPLYRNFMFSNTFAFVASLSAALLLVSGMPLRQRFLMWFLSIALSASLTSLAFTYLFGVLLLSPDSIYDVQDTVMKIAMGIWIGLLVLVMLLNTIRFFVWLKKTPRGSSKDQTENSANPENNVA